MSFRPSPRQRRESVEQAHLGLPPAEVAGGKGQEPPKSHIETERPSVTAVAETEVLTAKCLIVGAGETTRTSDLLITNQLLYQLSYASRGRRIIYGSRSRYGDVRTLEGQDRG